MRLTTNEKLEKGKELLAKAKIALDEDEYNRDLYRHFTKNQEHGRAKVRKDMADYSWEAYKSIMAEYRSL